MTLNQILFRYRSYTPLPFLAVMLVFARPTPAGMAAGGALALLGECLRAWGVMYAGSETRTTGGVGASRLVTSGPFAFVRNPLYVGNILLYTGIGVMSGALAPWLQLCGVAYFAFQYVMIVREEERWLHATFGDEYRAYAAAVPRFRFRLTPWRGGQATGPDWRAGFRSELRTLQAFLFVIVLLFVLWRLR